MSKPEILHSHVETFARIARREIERSIRSHGGDRTAFWHAVRLAYTRVPVELASSRTEVSVSR